MPLIKAFRMDGLGNRFIIVDRREKFINIPKEKIIHFNYTIYLKEDPINEMD